MRPAIRFPIGLNYRPVETFVVKFEYQINQTKNEVDDSIKLLRVNGIAPTKENISSGKYALQMSN